MARSNVGHVVVTQHSDGMVNGVSPPVEDVVDSGASRARKVDSGVDRARKVNRVGSTRAITVVSSAHNKIPPIRGGVSGYTGFVPGGRFVVGTNYRKTADDCFTALDRRNKDRRDKEDRERRSRSLGRLSGNRRRRVGDAGAGSRPQVNGDVRRNGSSRCDEVDREPLIVKQVRLPDINHSSAHIETETRIPAVSQGMYADEVIPIPGYTGFVPGARSSNLSVGKSFSRFANEGFHAMHESLHQYKMAKHKNVSFSPTNGKNSTPI